LFGLLENIAEVNQAMVKTVNIHQVKIDMMKFDSITILVAKAREIMVKLIIVN